MALQWGRYMENWTMSKVGIDTNVLLRYILQDDEQSKIATKFVESLSLEQQGFINNTVIIELIWVLSRTYKQTKSDIAMLLEELFSMPIFAFDNLPLLLKTLEIYKQSKADFSDILIFEFNQLVGCQTTVTFDVKAHKKLGMKLLN